ncbi:MAG: hypothetical protein L0Y54_14520 [Sporichthyaceae bacterium]|nr:hypothetical protein [Sporichthyaceae bacterium]
MKTMLITTSQGSDKTAPDLLRSAGHTVVFCYPDQHASRFCAGLGAGTTCRLEIGDIDIVVDARTDSATAASLADCARYHGVPFVVATPLPSEHGVPGPHADVQCAVADVVAGCAAVVSPTGPRSHRAVQEAATRLLRHHGATGELTVTLRARQREIDAFVTPEQPLPAPVRDAMRAVIRATLARYTPMWGYSQVHFSQ